MPYQSPSGAFGLMSTGCQGYSFTTAHVGMSDTLALYGSSLKLVLGTSARAPIRRRELSGCSAGTV